MVSYCSRGHMDGFLDYPNPGSHTRADGYHLLTPTVRGEQAAGVHNYPNCVRQMRARAVLFSRGINPQKGKQQ